MQNYLPACKIVSTHGVRGEMKALPLCDGAAFLAKFKRLFTTADGAGETRVLGVRAQGNVILLRLDGVNDMDAARAQVGRVYYLAKADARLPRRTSIPSPTLLAGSTCCPPCRNLSKISTSRRAKFW